MKEVMIDLETLSTENNAIIATIGAIKFDRTMDVPELKSMETFYIRIDSKSCELLNMHMDNSTIEWWKKQNEKSRNEIFSDENRISIKESLKKLSSFLKDCEIVWANSPNFDCIILENAYKKCKLKIPWKYYNLRDCRTVYDLGKISLDSIGKVSHNALEDCYNQILCLNKALKNIK